MEMQGPEILFTIPIFGGITITETIVNSWLIIVAVFILCKVLTRRMEKIPRRKTQILAEKIVSMIDNLVESTMGKQNMKYAPYILALFTASVLGSLISLLGLRSVTADINTTATWAIITFFLIQYNSIRSKGIRGYFKGFTQPVALLTPINIIGEFSTPLSMAIRHFANLLAGSMITMLLYWALASLSGAILPFDIPLFQVGIPAVLSLYFDLFTGFMQAFIFCMLTMVFVSNAQDTD